MRLVSPQAGEPVVARLNPEAVAAAAGNVVQTRLNPEAVARLTGATVEARLNTDALNKINNDNIVETRLNPEAVARLTGQAVEARLNMDAVRAAAAANNVVETRLNPEAVARLTGATVEAQLNMDAVRAAANKPVTMEINAEALKKAVNKPVTMEINAEALKKAVNKPVTMELNADALKALSSKQLTNSVNAVQAAEMDIIQQAMLSGLPSGVTLSAFSFNDCGAASNAAHVQQLSITPDPVRIPGNITISLKASLAANESSPIRAAIKLQKKSKIGTWNTIPCVDNIGSCTYDDICVLLEKIPLVDGQCPEEFQAHNLPCRCPIPSAAISVAGLSVAIPKIPSSVPAFLINGDFQLNVQLSGAGGQILCLNVALSLQTN